MEPAVTVELGRPFLPFLLHRRILRFAHYAKLKIEVRDRTLARTGLTAAESLTPEGGTSSKNQNLFLKI